MVGSALASRVQAHVERAKETGRIWRGHSFSCDNTDSVCPLQSPSPPLPLAPRSRSTEQSEGHTRKGYDAKIAQFLRFVGGAVLCIEDDATLITSPVEVSANL